jgi:hypothetical protein
MTKDEIKRVGKDAALRSAIPNNSKCKSCRFLLGRCKGARVTRVYARGYTIIEQCDMYNAEPLTIDGLEQLFSKVHLSTD